MMAITAKIILGIAPMGPVVGEYKAKAENHGTIKVQVTEAKILKGKILKEEGVVIRVEAGNVVTTHIKGNNKHILKIISHLQGHILIWLHCPYPPAKYDTTPSI